MSVLYLDLDGFKTVNDTLGHQAGDEILVAVSDHLRGVLRAEDTPARLGGDEFGILLEEDEAGAARAAERIARRFDRPWSISSGEVALGVSVGIASRRGDEELDQLLQQADVAMYAAKAGGHAGWRVFSPDEQDDASEPPTVRTELHRVLD